MLNWGIYLPMMFIGIFLWKRQLDGECSIIKIRLSFRWRCIVLLINIAVILLYAIVLHKAGAVQPLIDSTTTVLSITAMVLTLKRCVEQWLLWTAVNLLSVVMWFKVYLSTGGESVATLLWWIIMLISGIIFFVQWQRSLPAEKIIQENKNVII